MSASDYLHPAQFTGKADRSDRDKDKRATELDAKGADESAEFGYSDYDQGDYQWDRGKGKAREDDREVF